MTLPGSERVSLAGKGVSLRRQAGRASVQRDASAVGLAGFLAGAKTSRY